MSANVEDRALESNTQQVSITSNIKEDDKAKEEKLTAVARVVISCVIFVYTDNNLVLG